MNSTSIPLLEPILKDSQLDPRNPPILLLKHLHTAILVQLTEFISKLRCTKFAIEITQTNKIEARLSPDNDRAKSFIAIINDEIKTLLIAFDQYQEDLYNKHKLTDLYNVNRNALSEEVLKVVLNSCMFRYPKYRYPFTETLNCIMLLCTKNFQKEFDADFTSSPYKYETLASCLKEYKSYQRKYNEDFQEEIKTLIGPIDEPIFRSVQEVLDETIKMTTLKKYAKHYLKDEEILEVTVKRKIEDLFLEFLDQDKGFDNFFNMKRLGNAQVIRSFFSIILLTNCGMSDGKDDTVSSELVDKIYQLFQHDDDINLDTYIDALKQMKMSKSNKTMKIHLSKYREAWDEAPFALKLFGMTSLFIACKFTCKANEGYNSETRHSLDCLFQNLCSTEFTFLSSQILCAIESLAMIYLDDPEEPVDILNTESRILGRSTMRRVRKTRISKIDEHVHHKDQFKRFQYMLDENHKLAEKFIIEKISDPNKFSKNIILCVSGFTSEDYSKSEEWRDIVKMFPDTEVFAINWSSSAFSRILEEIIKESSFGLLRLFKVAHDKTCKVWYDTYEQAEITGRNLAHYLAKSHIFEGHAVSLVGFSLGTQVVMSCVYELERIKKPNILYEVLVMGGVAHIDDFYDHSLLSVSHRLINCYCSTDAILGIFLKYTNGDKNPIGLGPILRSSGKVTNVDVTRIAKGHLSYRDALYDVLLRVDFQHNLYSIFSCMEKHSKRELEQRSFTVLTNLEIS